MNRQVIFAILWIITQSLVTLAVFSRIGTDPESGRIFAAVIMGTYIIFIAYLQLTRQSAAT